MIWWAVNYHKSFCMPMYVVYSRECENICLNILSACTENMCIIYIIKVDITMMQYICSIDTTVVNILWSTIAANRFYIAIFIMSTVHVIHCVYALLLV